MGAADNGRRVDLNAREIVDIVAATAAVREAAAAAAEESVPIVLTARTENYLYGAGDLDDTIARLVSFRDAGAEVKLRDLQA